MDPDATTQSMCGAIADASHERLPPIDLSHHYSKTTRNRNASSVKDFYKYFKIPNIGNLAGGELPYEQLGALIV